MVFLLPLLAAALLEEAPQVFTVPESATAEYGHGLPEEEARAGWISLFDGRTALGWKGAEVAEARLHGGETTSPFGRVELRMDVVTGGDISLGGKTFAVSPGPFRKTFRAAKAGPIRLGAGVAVRSIHVRPLGLDAAFDGKSLNGWKVIPHPRRPPEEQAQWRVEDGVIAASGGPGALELRDAEFGDLVLQIEVRTRKELVNGGVFFRAIPGDFMNGYEAQIFNACLDRDPSRPARYSTGAIDDRQLARRLVSRDGKPFVMTVIAAGPHIATWVNGYQMTDWTDNRPPHENPRKGRRQTPGALQLQAHDRGTELEFRRVEIRRIR